MHRLQSDETFMESLLDSTFHETHLSLTMTKSTVFCACPRGKMVSRLSWFGHYVYHPHGHRTTHIRDPFQEHIVDRPMHLQLISILNSTLSSFSKHSFPVTLPLANASPVLSRQLEPIRTLVCPFHLSLPEPPYERNIEFRRSSGYMQYRITYLTASAAFPRQAGLIGVIRSIALTPAPYTLCRPLQQCKLHHLHLRFSAILLQLWRVGRARILTRSSLRSLDLPLLTR